MSVSPRPWHGGVLSSPAAMVWLAFAILLFAVQPLRVDIKDPELRAAGLTQASVVPDLWLPVFGFSSDTIIKIRPSVDLRVLTFGFLPANIGDAPALAKPGPNGVPWVVPLGFFALFMAALEALLAVAMHGREEKLIRPLVRAAGIFLVIWSFYGHQPFWDWFLAGIFPTSPDLLYNTNTVISLAGQHLTLVLVSSIITVAIGLTVGILVTRDEFREFMPFVSDVVNTGQRCLRWRWSPSWRPSSASASGPRSSH